MSGLNEKSRDPSMEDVLASIRKIIAEELDAAHHAAIEDIGPLDHNLPWSERQPNKQAKKSPPVLPVQAGSERPSSKQQGADSESDELDHAPVQNGVMTITDTDVSDEQRAAVAEFEQVVTALPVHEIHDSVQETVDASHAPSDLPEADLVSENDDLVEAALPDLSPADDQTVDPINLHDSANEWQSAPLPFDVLTFGSETQAYEDSVADDEATKPSHTEKSLSDADALALAAVNPYSDFLDAQKPQLNVKLDLSFLDQKFMDRGLSDKQPEAQLHHEDLPLAAVSPIPEPVAHAPDFSIFGQDRAPAPLPPFIPANEPTYAPLVSQRTTDALLSSLRHLTEATRPQASPEAPQETILAPRLDVFMADVLRPLLSQWLDANLERIVDQAVRDEIAKVTQKIRP
jgi:cell pole-organizing protein PopZ